MSFYLPLDHHYAAGVWAVLDRFGYKMAFEELNGSGIHRLENVLTLTPDVHISFDTLRVWLEPVEVSNSAPRVNWGFELVSRIYPTLTNFVRLALHLCLCIGSLP